MRARSAASSGEIGESGAGGGGAGRGVKVTVGSVAGVDSRGGVGVFAGAVLRQRRLSWLLAGSHFCPVASGRNRDAHGATTLGEGHVGHAEVLRDVANGFGPDELVERGAGEGDEVWGMAVSFGWGDGSKCRAVRASGKLATRDRGANGTGRLNAGAGSSAREASSPAWHVGWRVMKVPSSPGRQGRRGGAGGLQCATRRRRCSVVDQGFACRRSVGVTNADSKRAAMSWQRRG